MAYKVMLARVADTAAADTAAVVVAQPPKVVLTFFCVALSMGCAGTAKKNLQIHNPPMTPATATAP
jgi:hypothetical protein